MLGRAEHGLRALLERILAGSADTCHEWVALSLTAGAGGAVGRDQLIERMTHALKIDDATADTTNAKLAAERLVAAADGDNPVELTDAGKELHRQVSAAVAETTSRLYGDIPADDLATAGRVLSAIAARANDELSPGEHGDPG